MSRQISGNVYTAPSGGGGGFFSDVLAPVLNTAGLVTSFIPGAQVASPFLSGAGALASGDLTGAAKNTATGVAGIQSQGPEVSEPPQNQPQFDEQGNNTNPPPLYTEGKLDQYAEAAVQGPQLAGNLVDPMQYLTQFFQQNPYFLLQLLGQQQQYPGAQQPPMGFGQFA